MQSRPSIYKTAGKSALLAVFLTSLISCGGSSEGSKNSSSTSVTSSSSSFSSAVTSYNLTYGASAGGSISGQTSQDVAAGSSGSSVTAIPAVNYRFTGWSDGSLKATRTDSNIQQSATLTANFAPENIWSTAPYSGAMSLEVLGPRSVNVIWDDNEPRTIMVISEGITAEVSIGAPEGVSWHVGVTSPFKLENLKADIPVYVALQQDDVITAWSSTTPRKWIADGEIKTIQQMENGNIFLGGDFEYIAPDHGSAVLLPSASSGITNPTPLAFPHVNGLVYSAVDDGQGGWFIGGNFTKVGNHEKHGFAHIDRMGQVLPWQPVEGDIRQIKKRNGILYIGGNYKTASNSYLVALSAFEINNNTPEFHVELANPAGYPGYPTYVNQVELAKDRIYVHGHINFPDNIVAIDYNGNILNWPTELIDFFSPLKIVTFNNDLYIQTEVFMLPFFYKIDAAGKASKLSFDLPGERLWGMFSDSEYLYINIEFNAAAIGEQPANHIRLDAQGNRSFLNLPSTQDPIVIHNEIMYYTNWNTDEQEGGLTAYDLNDEKKTLLLAANYPSTIAVSENTILISAAALLLGQNHKPGLVLLNEHEELQPWSVTNIGKITSSTVINNVIYAGGSTLSAFDQNGNKTDWVPNLSPYNSSLPVDAAPTLINDLKSHHNTLYLGGEFRLRDNNSPDFSASNLVALNSEHQLLWGQPQSPLPVFNLAVNESSLFAITIEHDTVGKITNPLYKLDHDSFSFSKIATLPDSRILSASNNRIYFKEEPHILGAVNMDGTPEKWQLNISGHGASAGATKINDILAIEDRLYVAVENFRVSQGEQSAGLLVYTSAGRLLDWTDVPQATTLNFSKNKLMVAGSLTEHQWRLSQETHKTYNTYKIYDLDAPLKNQ